MMREFYIGNTAIRSEEDNYTCDYLILVEESGGSIACERYGIKIVLREKEESAEICDICLNADRIFELAALLCRNAVTPCALRDVIDDWL